MRCFCMGGSVESYGSKGMIRHCETDQFYKGNGHWTSTTREAMRFDNLSTVASEAKKHGLDKGCCEYVVEVNGTIGLRIKLPL